MDENGSRSSHRHRSWTLYSLGTLMDNRSGGGSMLYRRWWEAFTSSSGLWTVAIIGILLCQLHPTAATSIVCPSQCWCSNVTSPNDGMHVITIDCSNGSLHSFFHSLSIKSQTNTPNVSQSFHNSGNESELNFATNSNNNHTKSLVQAESNETENVWHGNLHTGPIKFSNTDSSGKSHLLISGIILDLSFNNVTSLQAVDLYEWRAASLVKKINLGNNWIESLDNASSLHFLVNLVSLDLSNNRISILSLCELRHFSSLQYLYLNNNRIHITQNTGTIAPHLYSNLVYLDLSHNHVAGLPDRAFSVFPTLLSLNLSINNISWINPFAFVGLIRLQTLSLSQNPILSLEYPVFQNTSLTDLSLAHLPYLSSLHHTAFHGLPHLKYLNLSHNPHLSFLHPNILSGLNSINVLDLSGSGIRQLSPITFQNKPQLQTVYLHNLPLMCKCTNAWLVDEIYKNNSIYKNISSIQCSDTEQHQAFPLADAVFPCEEVLIHNMTHALSVSLGSTMRLQCKQASAPDGEILSWTTPRGHVFYFHHFHPNASQHLLSPKDVKFDAPFHQDHDWHQSSSYYSELSSEDNRILMLSDGSLFIDYMMRTDAGLYTCMVKNAHYNNSGTVVVHLVYKISGEVKIIACIVGILCAVGVFTLNLVYIIIMWLARHLINKRRRENIGQMLENLNSYKSTQITRIYENYTCQLNRVRSQYHNQRGRLHRNYTMQVDRVKRGCSHQVEKVRDNYNSKLTNLREYSSNQIMQIRDIATTQIGRIRDYGSSQLGWLRETYKLQHQHMMKLLDTLNLDNCRSIVETECMRTESMMYDLDLLSQEDERTESPYSTAESEYNTATSSPVISVGFISVGSREPNVALHDEEENIQVREVGGEGFDISGGEGNFLTTLSHENEGGEGRVHKEPIANAYSNHQANDVNEEDDDAIEIEMNSTFNLPDNVQLDAKEVWSYKKADDIGAGGGGEKHTLYTKVRCPKERGYLSPQNNPQSSVHGQTYTEIGQEEDYSDPAKTKTAFSLPCIDLNLRQTSMGEPEWGSVYTQQEASPVKICLRPAYFQYEDEEDIISTVNLYDADVDEDDDGEEDEKTENDTMV